MYKGLGLYIDGAWRQGSGGRMQAVLEGGSYALRDHVEPKYAHLVTQ